VGEEGVDLTLCFPARRCAVQALSDQVEQLGRYDDACSGQFYASTSHFGKQPVQWCAGEVDSE
jgi:hypothetical protein